MSGTITGGKNAAKTNKERHGKDFYARIGAIGGRNSRHGGFASQKECYCELIDGKHFYQQCAGKKGGTKSRKSKKW